MHDAPHSRDRYLKPSTFFIFCRMLSETTKILILPQEVEEIALFDVQLSGQERSLITGNNEVYEVLEVIGHSSFDTTPAPQLPSMKAVKSIILESENGDGYCLQSPNVLLATKFDMTYFFSALLHDRLSFSSRYKSASDIKDELLDLAVINGWNDIIECAFQRSLANICQSILEGDEAYFKFSREKFFSFLRQKVEKLSDFIFRSPNLSLHKMIRSSLVSSIQVPEDIFRAQTLRYATDMVLLSYYNPTLRDEFIDAEGYKFDDLLSYLEEARKDNENGAILTPLSTVSTKIVPRKNKGKKDLRVAVGKGALDSFFKKA